MVTKIRSIKTVDFKSIKEISKVYGVNLKSSKNFEFSIINCKKKGIFYIKKCKIKLFDEVESIFFNISTDKKISFNKDKNIVLFSGHGSAKDLIFGKNFIDFLTNVDFDSFDTYQSKLALKLAEPNRSIFVLENRCMGYMNYLGDYKTIDAYYRLSGGSLMGIWLSDAIFFLDFINSKVINKSISTFGISTGGFLSLFSSLYSKNINHVICQGYLSNFKESYLQDKSSINYIYNLSKYNFHSIFKFLKNIKRIDIINGELDNFKPSDAFIEIKNARKKYNIHNINFHQKKGLGHKVDLSLVKSLINEI